MVAISTDWAHFAEMTQNMLSSSLGIVDPERISEALQKVRRGEEVPMVTLTAYALPRRLAQGSSRIGDHRSGHNPEA